MEILVHVLRLLFIRCDSDETLTWSHLHSLTFCALES